MKKVYPVIFFDADDECVIAYVPDFDVCTQGSDLADAIAMARDAIGINGIDMEDEGKSLPTPSKISDLPEYIEVIGKATSDTLVNLVDVDFAEYRRQNELRTVKKNCTLPSWLCYKAEKANINFSLVLQNALKKELNIS